MDESRFLTCLESDYRRLREVAAGALTAPVPSCPGWTGADLVRHVAEVYLHKKETIRLGDWPRPWPPELGDDVLGALDRAYDELVAELARHDPADPALAWYTPDQTVGFWIRRMAYETVIHRLDAELAAGAAHDPIPADLAEHGIEEVLVCFLSFASREYPDELGSRLSDCDGRTVRVGAGATGWQVRLGPTEVTVARGRADQEAGVSGEPDEVLRWLWGRAGDEVVRLDGDRWVAGRLRDLLAVTT